MVRSQKTYETGTGVKIGQDDINCVKGLINAYKEALYYDDIDAKGNDPTTLHEELQDLKREIIRTYPECFTEVFYHAIVTAPLHIGLQFGIERNKAESIYNKVLNRITKEIK